MNTVLMREDAFGATVAGRPYRWLQYIVIAADVVTIIDMTPAVAGWNFGAVTLQGADCWPGMTPEAIRAYIERNWPNTTTPNEQAAESVLAWLSKARAA